MFVLGRRDPKEPRHSFHRGVLKRRRLLTKDSGLALLLYCGRKQRAGSPTSCISVFGCAHLQHMLGTRAVNGSLKYCASDKLVFEERLLLQGSVTSVSWCWTDTCLFTWRCWRTSQDDCCRITSVWFLHKAWPWSDIKPPNYSLQHLNVHLLTFVPKSLLWNVFLWAGFKWCDEKQDMLGESPLPPIDAILLQLFGC